MKRSFAMALSVFVFLAVSFVGYVSAADQKAAPAKPAVNPGDRTPASQKSLPKPNFNMLTGIITKIDSSDPANVKIEVKNEADNAIHTVAVMPWTNVSKVTTVSELKTGELVRVMSRKMDDKDVAMGILFGNIKAVPKAPPMGKPTTPAVKPVAPVKK